MKQEILRNHKSKLYFAKLPNALIEKLHKWYKMDFEMFNYDHKDFLS